MSDFGNLAFEGNFPEAKKYLAENFADSKWDCPTGQEDLEGIIDVLDAGAHQPGVEEEVIFEVDYSGNIRCKGDMETFANITEIMQIKELRKLTGMSQREFSEYFGIPLRTIQCWEIGQRTPPDYIPKLLERIWNLEIANQ